MERDMQKVVRDLLARAKGTDSEHEAKEAILKAQYLIAKHNIVMDEETQEPEEMLYQICEHPGNAGFREWLGGVIAPNFRVMCFLPKGSIAFFGHRSDVLVAKEVFEYAYLFAFRKSRRIVDDLRKRYMDTSGVRQSYLLGFCMGLRDGLEAQSKLLMVVVPQDVKDKVAELRAREEAENKDKKKKPKRQKLRARNSFHIDNFSPAYHEQGRKDGREALEERDQQKAG